MKPCKECDADGVVPDPSTVCRDEDGQYTAQESMECPECDGRCGFGCAEDGCTKPISKNDDELCDEHLAELEEAAA